MSTLGRMAGRGPATYPGGVEDDVGWKRLMAVAAGLLLSAACDATGSLVEGGTGDTGDTGISTVTTQTHDATQVGSEGFWGCPIERIDPLDPASQAPGFTEPVGTAVGAHLGAWTLQVTDAATATTGGGTLTLEAGTSWRWVDVADDTGCVDHAMVDVTAELSRDGQPPVELVGKVVVRPDGEGGVVATADRALAEGAWGVGTTGGTLFRLEGSLGTAALSATTAYADCPVSEPHCPSAAVLAALAGSR